LQDKKFNEENKDYDFSIIELTNTVSSMNSEIINYKLVSYDENGVLKEYDYILPTDYEEIKDKEDKILLS